RVYSDPQNQDSSMDGPLNDTMNGHADNVEDDDLQVEYENLSHVQKRQNLMMQRKIDVLCSKKQMEQDDYVENEDLPAHYKDNCSNDK
ncbi:Unknown protein, partial [Striga hermonthica]